MRPNEIMCEFIDRYQTGGDEAALEQYIARDVVDHSRPPGISPGAQGVREQFDGFRAAFSDFSAEVLDMICERDKVVTRKVFRGVHTGSFQGIEPTGRSVDIHVIDIVRIEDGRVVEHWNSVDRLGLLAQLGALPEADPLKRD